MSKITSHVGRRQAKSDFGKPSANTTDAARKRSAKYARLQSMTDSQQSSFLLIWQTKFAERSQHEV